MARSTGNAAPAGFAAGQLRDGNVIGIFDWYDNNLGAGAQITVTVRVRYYRETLILEWQRKNKSSGAVSQDWRISSREYMQNIAGGVNPSGGTYQELIDSLPYFATISQISALLGSGVDLVPVAPTNALIPFEADADGRVKPYTAAVNQNQILANLAQTQQQLANNLTGGTSNTTTGTGMGTNNTVRNVLIVTAVISVIVIVGIVIVKAVGKKK